MDVYAQARKAISILTALCDAHNAVESGKAVDVAPVESAPIDKEAQKTTARNIALAGSGDKAALMGTLDSEPTLTAKDLEAVGIDTVLAEAVIVERNTIRADAFALTAAVAPSDIKPVAPIEEIKL